MRVMAAASRVSPVSALKAKPRTAMCYESAYEFRTSPGVAVGAYLASDGVEESLDDTLGEACLLVLVHLHNLAPVCGDLG